MKESAKRDPERAKLIETITQPGSKWEIVGLSDCEGPPELNKSLRQQRAEAVRRDLAPVAGDHIVAARGAPLDECITPNQNRVARSWNRSVLIRNLSSEYTFEPDVIEGKRKTPKPAKQSTSDCTDKQEKEIAQAGPIAVEMLRTALNRLRNRRDDPGIRALLRKHFQDDSEKTVSEAHDGLVNTLKGFRSGITFECEEKGSFMYDHFCGGNTFGYARNWLVALNVHLCELAFGKSDLKLAEILIHEVSHIWDHTDDKAYEWQAEYRTLSPKAALDNADSYAHFARDAYETEDE